VHERQIIRIHSFVELFSLHFEQSFKSPPPDMTNLARVQLALQARQQRFSLRLHHCAKSSRQLSTQTHSLHLVKLLLLIWTCRQIVLSAIRRVQLARARVIMHKCRVRVHQETEPAKRLSASSLLQLVSDGHASTFKLKQTKTVWTRIHSRMRSKQLSHKLLRQALNRVLLNPFCFCAIQLSLKLNCELLVARSKLACLPSLKQRTNETSFGLLTATIALAL
jgi:hypothetical protein